MFSPFRALPAWTLAALLTGPSAAVPQSLDILLNCSACHTLDRNDTSDAAPRYPVLNGQPARYIGKQLEAYRTGVRQHPQMQMTARALGVHGDVPMARMYAHAPAPDLVRPPLAEDVGIAEELVQNGAWDRGVAPCESCHMLGTVDGIDMSARAAPRLHGQPEYYLADQLRAYADGSRQTGPMGRMQAYASALDVAEIDALAAYYASFRERDAP